ncbi:hypothetical protein SAMN05661093_10698 [Kibdelosporangium aridum]|uniref:Uncharacterized protein n=1 Tax=Kibdelosporangium aridum TaxID=2030 RepID=A0A1W2FYX4_KIBAR|nr:hypothetical protein SAMN05661093_10698 [Kibdelosporangium aridum]
MPHGDDRPDSARVKPARAAVERPYHDGRGQRSESQSLATEFSSHSGRVRTVQSGLGHCTITNHAPLIARQVCNVPVWIVSRGPSTLPWASGCLRASALVMVVGRLGCCASPAWEWEKIGRVRSACRCLRCGKLTSTDLCCAGGSLFPQVTLLYGPVWGSRGRRFNPVVPTVASRPSDLNESSGRRAFLCLPDDHALTVHIDLNQDQQADSGAKLEWIMKLFDPTAK